MSVIYEHYKSLDALLNTIENRPLNRVFKNREKASNAAETRDKWYKTKDYAEAKELLKFGFKEPLEKMKKELVKIDKNSGPIERPRQYLSVQGYKAHVPNAIKGLPISMMNREPRQIKARTIHLVYGFSALGDVKSNELIKGGTMFIGLLNALEKSGIRVKLDIMRATTASAKDAIIYTVNLKQYDQSLNLLKLCFPLVHPSMLRRISFRWCETLPKLSNSVYGQGYGATLAARLGYNGDKERQFLRDNNVIKGENTYYCNVYEAMKAENIQELAQTIGLK